MADISSTVVLEKLKPSGEVERKHLFHSATLVLGRNQFNDVVLKLACSNREFSYRVKNLTIFSKFVTEGKATIKLNNDNTQLLVSDCPPDKLKLFLQTLSTKQQTGKTTSVLSERQRLLSDKKDTFHEISPLTIKDLESAHKAKLRAAIANSMPNKVTVTEINSKGTKRKLDDLNKENELQLKIFRQNMDTSTKESTEPKFNISVIKLTIEQQKVLQAVTNGKNIFFTGSAGTGKSFLLKRIIGALPPSNTFATATTGVAACHIGGTTLHSFAGIGSGKGPLEQCIDLAKRPQFAQNWKKCRHLIIDEVSMVSGELFDKLEAVARMVRQTDTPFGGIQLILCGDFFQLPPVTKGNQKQTFAFQASSWNKCIDLSMLLTEVKRQEDKKFVKLLNQIRMGHCTEEVNLLLQNSSDNQIEEAGIEATRLCTHKEHVDRINVHRLEALTGKSRLYEASDGDPLHTTHLDCLCPVGKKLELKIGAQVMLTKNMDVQRGLANGARGIIQDFEKNHTAFPIVRFLCGETITVTPERWMFRLGNGSYMTRRQIPLQLAWAISIHKSQGMTLDCVEVSLASVFEYGQAYVALSRCKSLNGLRVVDFNSNSIKTNPDVIKFYKSLKFNSY